MTLNKDEYIIKDDFITIPKKVLERLRDHYSGISSMGILTDEASTRSYYLGKLDVFKDLLKLFEPLEG